MLDGELAVPCNPRSAYAGLKILHENQEVKGNFVDPGDEVDHT